MEAAHLGGYYIHSDTAGSSMRGQVCIGCPGSGVGCSGRLKQAFQTTGAIGISLVKSKFPDQSVSAPFVYSLALEELPGTPFHAPGSPAPRGPAALLLVWLST